MDLLPKLAQLAKEFQLNLSEDSIETMLKLVESGMSPDNLVNVIRELQIERSLSEYKIESD